MGLFRKKQKVTPSGQPLGKGLPVDVEVGFGGITSIGFTTIYTMQGKPGMVHIKNGYNHQTARLVGIKQHTHKGKYLGKVDLQLEDILGLRYAITIKANSLMLVALSGIGV